MENHLLSAVVFAPLVGAVICWVAGRRVRSEAFIGAVACSAIGVSAVCAFLVAFSSYFGDVTGQLFVFIVMTVAAAEAAVGLGIIISIFRNRESLDVDDASILRL